MNEADTTGEDDVSKETKTTTAYVVFGFLFGWLIFWLFQLVF